MAHFQDGCDLGHRQAASVSGSYRLVSLCSEVLGALIEIPLSLDVVSGELRKPGVRLRCFPLRSRNPVIVGPIPANELAENVQDHPSGWVKPPKEVCLQIAG